MQTKFWWRRFMFALFPGKLILKELYSLKQLIQTMSVSQQDLIDGLATLDKDIQDEIARFTLEVSNAVAAGRLPDGTVTLSQDEAQALLGKVNAIDAAVKAAGNS